MNNLETITLDNGLNIYLYNDLKKHSTFFQITTFCGGINKHFIYNNKKYHIKDGVHHILEHYIVECNEEGNFLDKLGDFQMTTNASTSINNTSYYFQTVENVLFGINTILNGIYNVKFDEEKLEKLKNPICQEIRGKIDNKFYHLNKMRISNLFNNIDYVDVGGELSDVEDTSIDDLKILYDAFYHPANQFIVIAGNFNKDEVINTIKKFYKEHIFSKYNTKLIAYNENVSIKKKKDILYFPTSMNYYNISFKIDISKYNSNELLDMDFYLNSFYASSFGPTSNLYKKLINNKIISDYINASHSIIDKFLIISIGAYCEREDKFRDEVIKILNDVSLIKKDKFELDKKSSIVSLILRSENIFSLIMPFIDNLIIYNYPYLDSIDDVKKLNFNDYIDCIKNIDFSNYIEITIKNKTSK